MQERGWHQGGVELRLRAAEKGFWRQMARRNTAPETATAVARATPCEVMREEEEDIRRKNGVRDM